MAGIFLASLVKYLQFSGGGATVARSLGGEPIHPNSQDLAHRRALNVVEEMAIASGMPVPTVYLIKEPGINAFAAGFNTSDAVIGLTEGAVNRLSRDELQGVVAHEFSHILNGDMRLNLRLIAILAGILFIGQVGFFIMRSAAISGRRSRNNNAGSFVMLGLALAAIGYVGTFFGSLIKAAVSRQREFLADASAVQFTRNPEGISNALKAIGGVSEGSTIESPNADEMSHFFFGQAISSGITNLFATHPPLNERIRRIDPNWNGKFPIVGYQQFSEFDSPATSGFAQSSQEHRQHTSDMTEHINSGDSDQWLDTSGELNDSGLDKAQSLIGGIPRLLYQASHSTDEVSALILSLIIAPADDLLFSRAVNHLANEDLSTANIISHLRPDTKQLNPELFFPLLSIAAPALSQLSTEQGKKLRQQMIAFAHADGHLSVSEWSLYQWVIHQLNTKEKPRVTDNKKIAQLKDEIHSVLFFLAHHGNDSPQEVEHALKQGLKNLDLPLNSSTPEQLSLQQLGQALERLNTLAPLEKPKLLKACIACIESDGKVLVKEIELLRTFAAIFDCPLPPKFSYLS